MMGSCSGLCGAVAGSANRWVVPNWLVPDSAETSTSRWIVEDSSTQPRKAIHVICVPTSATASPKLTRRSALNSPGREMGGFGSPSDVAMISASRWGRRQDRKVIVKALRSRTSPSGAALSYRCPAGVFVGHPRLGAGADCRAADGSVAGGAYAAMVELAAVGPCCRAVHKSYLEKSIARLAALEGDLGRVRQVFVSPSRSTQHVVIKFRH